MDRLIQLREVPLFARLTLDRLDAIHRLMSEERYLRGEVIFRQGDLGDRLYVLIEGEVSVWRDHETPAQVLLAVQSPVSCFGEMGVLDDAPRSATIVASADAQLLALDGARLRELVLQMPELAFDFFQVLTERVRRSDERLQEALARGGPGQGE